MPTNRHQARRRPPPLKPGFSQMHWMKLVTSSDDLTEGVGVVDADEPHSRTWRMEEVRAHNTRQDAWMVLRGRVYNITRYLQFHPGSVEELMRAAGDDATALFDEVHPWVNAEAMLEPCCVGVLAPAEKPAAAAAAAAAAEPPQPALPTLHADEWRAFTVVAKEAAGTDSVWLRFGLPEGVRLGCLVGEHVQVRAKAADGRRYVRMYTPVSAHKAEGHFELLVRRCEPAALSPALCAINVGGTVEMRGPRGAQVYGGFGAARLRLPGRAALSGGSGVVAPTCVVSLSAGSGIAPTLFLLRSLAHVHEASGVSALPAVRVVHASRSLDCVPGLAELRRLVGLLPGASLCLALSAREAAEAAEAPKAGAEEEHAGRLDGELLARLVPPAADDVVLLCCGTPGFNGEVARAAGHEEANLHVF